MDKSLEIISDLVKIIKENNFKPLTDTSEKTKRILKEDVDKKNSEGRTALMCAKDAKQTRILLDTGADPNIQSNDGTTALMYAKDAEQTRILLNTGADPNIQSNDGTTALMYAKTAEQMWTLIKYRADINHKNNDGKSIIFYAINKGFTGIVEYIEMMKK